MQGAETSVQVLFQSYFKNTQISGVVLPFSLIPIIVFTSLARKLVVKFGKKELSVVGTIFCSVAIIGLLVLSVAPDGNCLMLYVICQLINSLGMGIYSTVSWAMMGDAIDYNE